MSDMTEHAIGSVDAVADSLIEQPVAEEEQLDLVDEQEASQPDEEIQQDDQSDEPEEVEQDEDVEEDEELGSDNEELFYTVKIDGEEKEVSLDELTRSYSGQKYIQKGMQQAAEARKAVEAEIAQVQQQSQQLQTILQAAQSGQLNLTPPTPPSRELFEQDPIGFMDEKLRYEENLAHYNEQVQQVQYTLQQQDQINQQQMQQHLSNEMEKLVQVDPDFSNPERAKQVKTDMLEFAESIGFTPEDIRGINDHRALLVLKNAAMYAKLQKSKPQAKQKAQNARPYVKAGAAKKPVASKVKKARQAKSKMKQTGSIDDVANFLIS